MQSVLIYESILAAWLTYLPAKAIISRPSFLLRDHYQIYRCHYVGLCYWALTGIQKNSFVCIENTVLCHEDPKYLIAKGKSLSIHLAYAVKTVNAFFFCLSHQKFQRNQRFENIYFPSLLGSQYPSSLLLFENILIAFKKED